jgi:hypothetical protein
MDMEQKRIADLPSLMPNWKYWSHGNQYASLRALAEWQRGKIFCHHYEVPHSLLNWI